MAPKEMVQNHWLSLDNNSYHLQENLVCWAWGWGGEERVAVKSQDG